MKRQKYVVHYSGHVQGVGFRYTVCRLSSHFEVKGFVRNLPDGRVQVVAEGQTDQLDLFLQSIRQEMAGYIRGENLNRQEYSGEYSEFGLGW